MSSLCWWACWIPIICPSQYALCLSLTFLCGLRPLRGTASAGFHCLPALNWVLPVGNTKKNVVGMFIPPVFFMRDRLRLAVSHGQKLQLQFGLPLVFPLDIVSLPGFLVTSSFLCSFAPSCSAVASTLSHGFLTPPTALKSPFIKISENT